MRLAWEAAVVGLLLVIAGLAPTAAAGPTDECTTVHYAVDEGTGGRLQACPQGDPIDWDVWTGPPGVPGLPGSPVGDSRGCGGESIGHSQELANGDSFFVCVLVNESAPSAPGLPDPDPGSGTNGCEGHREEGHILTLGQTRAGACIILEATPPRTDGEPFLDIDTTSCELSTGPGSDPSITFMDGGVVFCAALVYELGPPGFGGVGPVPGVEYDLTPCSAQSVDPTVWVGDGYVQVCVEAGADVQGTLSDTLWFLGW